MVNWSSPKASFQVRILASPSVRIFQVTNCQRTPKDRALKALSARPTGQAGKVLASLKQGKMGWLKPYFKKGKRKFLLFNFL